MTDITAGRLHRASKVIVHPLTVRITHWVNALAMVIMIMSGWRIYNSEPICRSIFPSRSRSGAVSTAPSISTTRMGLRAPCSGILPACGS